MVERGDNAFNLQQDAQARIHIHEEFKKLTAFSGELSTPKFKCASQLGPEDTVTLALNLRHPTSWQVKPTKWIGLGLKV